MGDALRRDQYPACRRGAPLRALALAELVPVPAVTALFNPQTGVLSFAIDCAVSKADAAEQAARKLESLKG